MTLPVLILHLPFSLLIKTAIIWTFRLPSYLLWHWLPRRGGYHPLRFSVWFKILYRV